MICFKNVSKEYTVADQKIHALSNINFTIEAGQLTVILGPSGSGKSTLLNLLGGMDRATNGVIQLGDKNITNLSDHQLSIYRRDVIGFVFQFYNLIPNLTALENIGIAAHLTDNVKQAEKILEGVGLGHRKHNFPSQLSGGEMQRVAIARALAKAPQLLLCDEPTGALDSKTGIHILQILKDVAQTKNTAVVLVTHNAAIASMAHKVITLQDGKINDIVTNRSPINNVEEVTW